MVVQPVEMGFIEVDLKWGFGSCDLLREGSLGKNSGEEGKQDIEEKRLQARGSLALT